MEEIHCLYYFEPTVNDQQGSPWLLEDGYKYILCNNPYSKKSMAINCIHYLRK